MFNYKTLSIFLLFVDFSWLGLTGLNHDSYKICLSFASVILATAVVCCFLGNRILRIVSFVILAVVFSQFSMVAREAIKKPEIRENFNQRNTTDELYKDIKHAFSRLWSICRNEPTAEFEAEEEDPEKKSGKHRYAGLIIGFLLSLPQILKKPREKRTKQKK